MAAITKEKSTNYSDIQYLKDLESILHETNVHREEPSFFEKIQLDEDNNIVGISSCLGGNTTHFSVADKDGNLVGITSSLGETSGVFIPEIGMLTNNILGEEGLLPPAISFKPGDRILTMCCPSLVELDGNTYILGSAGSDRYLDIIIKKIIQLLIIF